MSFASRRGYISFLLMVPLSLLVLTPLLLAPLPPSSPHFPYSVLRMENEQLSLKRALLVSARDTLTHTSQSSLDELTYSALIATHFPTDASCAPQSFADTALITGDPNPTLSFTLLNTNEQTCLLRARIFDTWSSLLEEWNLHSDYHAQLKCDAPLSVSSALNSCASHLQWQNYGVAGPHLLVDNFWSLHLSHASISNLSITSPLPAIEVTP